MVQGQDQQNENGFNSSDDIPEAKVSPILKWSIIIMSTLIVLIIVFLISYLIYSTVNPSKKSVRKTYSSKGFGKVDLEVSPGSKVGEVTLNGNRMSVVIHRAAGGDEIVLIDVRSGEVLGRIQFKEK